MKGNTTPMALIRVLADGQRHSGQQLGQQLGISRAAVHKYMQRLRSWGLEIHSSSGIGYQLSQPLQLLDAELIQRQAGAQTVTVLSMVDSTNQVLLDKLTTLRSGECCVAEYQTAGRGRRGRKWFSPFGTNLYLSMYWCLPQGPAASVGLSLVVGVTIAEVLRQTGAQSVNVKWPNDLYLHDRKLAGILVELTGKTGDAAHLVIGAGVNLLMCQAACGVLDQPWISLQEAGIAVDRNQLTVQLIQALRGALRTFEQEGLTPFVQRWQRLDNFIDRPVKLLLGERSVTGIARGIDSQGALLLEQDGVITSWNGGEISLRSAVQASDC